MLRDGLAAAMESGRLKNTQLRQVDKLIIVYGGRFNDGGLL